MIITAIVPIFTLASQDLGLGPWEMIFRKTTNE
jgi:hypothetical protein